MTRSWQIATILVPSVTAIAAVVATSRFASRRELETYLRAQRQAGAERVLLHFSECLDAVRAARRAYDNGEGPEVEDAVEAVLAAARRFDGTARALQIVAGTATANAVDRLESFGWDELVESGTAVDLLCQPWDEIYEAAEEVTLEFVDAVAAEIGASALKPTQRFISEWQPGSTVTAWEERRFGPAPKPEEKTSG